MIDKTGTKVTMAIYAIGTNFFLGGGCHNSKKIVQITIKFSSLKYKTKYMIRIHTYVTKK